MTRQLDDRAIANDAAAYCRKYPIEHLLYSQKNKRGDCVQAYSQREFQSLTWIRPILQSCDELLGAINSGQIKRHTGQAELSTPNAFSGAASSWRWWDGSLDVVPANTAVCACRCHSFGDTFCDTPRDGDRHSRWLMFYCVGKFCAWEFVTFSQQARSGSHRRNCGS